MLFTVTQRKFIAYSLLQLLTAVTATLLLPRYVDLAFQLGLVVRKYVQEYEDKLDRFYRYGQMSGYNYWDITIPLPVFSYSALILAVTLCFAFAVVMIFGAFSVTKKQQTTSLIFSIFQALVMTGCYVLRLEAPARISVFMLGCVGLYVVLMVVLMSLLKSFVLDGKNYSAEYVGKFKLGDGQVEEEEKDESEAMVKQGQEKKPLVSSVLKKKSRKESIRTI